MRPGGWRRSNITVRRADAAREPLGDDEFDAAVEAVHAALRPGRRLFVFDTRLVPAGHPGKRLTTRLLRGALATRD